MNAKQSIAYFKNLGWCLEKRLSPHLNQQGHTLTMWVLYSPTLYPHLSFAQNLQGVWRSWKTLVGADHFRPPNQRGDG